MRIPPRPLQPRLPTSIASPSSNGHTPKPIGSATSNGKARAKVSQLLGRVRHGTDSVTITSGLPPHQNPAFIWAMVQITKGESANAVSDTLSAPERKLLTALDRTPAAKRLEWRDAYRDGLPEAEREAFDRLITATTHDPTQTLSMADVMRTVEGIRWLCRDWLPYGMLSQICAEPGIGKSALALGGFIRSVITASKWPDGKTGLPSPQMALWCDTESKMPETVERMKQWGIPADRIKIPFDNIYTPVSLHDPQHLQRIEYLIGLHKIHLVVIDALRTAHTSEENSSKIASLLQPVAQIAERTNAAILFVHHSRKLGDGEEITANSSRGSNAIFAMMRVAIGIDRPDAKSDWLRVRVVKTNAGKEPPPFGFRIAKSGLEFGRTPERPKRDTETGRAITFLRERLADGKPHAAADLISDADAAMGIAKRTLQRAALETLGAKSVKTEEGWTWTLGKMPTNG